MYPGHPMACPSERCRRPPVLFLVAGIKTGAPIRCKRKAGDTKTRGQTSQPFRDGTRDMQSRAAQPDTRNEKPLLPGGGEGAWESVLLRKTARRGGCPV